VNKRSEIFFVVTAVETCYMTRVFKNFISLTFQLTKLYPKIISHKSYLNTVSGILPPLNVPCEDLNENNIVSLCLRYVSTVFSVPCPQLILYKHILHKKTVHAKINSNFNYIRLPQWRTVDPVKIILLTFLQIKLPEFCEMSILQNLSILNLVYFL
jgi:hypothetical protein